MHVDASYCGRRDCPTYMEGRTTMEWGDEVGCDFARKAVTWTAVGCSLRRWPTVPVPCESMQGEGRVRRSIMLPISRKSERSANLDCLVGCGIGVANCPRNMYGNTRMHFEPRAQIRIAIISRLHKTQWRSTVDMQCHRPTAHSLITPHFTQKSSEIPSRGTTRPLFKSHRKAALATPFLPFFKSHRKAPLGAPFLPFFKSHRIAPLGALFLSSTLCRERLFGGLLSPLLFAQC